jgi:hypothetical protein
MAHRIGFGPREGDQRSEGGGQREDGRPLRSEEGRKGEKVRRLEVE